VPGFVTVTGIVPFDIIAVLGIIVVSLDPLVQAVVSATPLKLMTAFPLKFAPSTSNGKELVVAITLRGFNWVIVGIVPGVGGVVVFDPYPHPMATPQSSKTVNTFIVFLRAKGMLGV
jgi:hypothetical protein